MTRRLHRRHLTKAHPARGAPSLFSGTPSPHLNRTIAAPWPGTGYLHQKAAPTREKADKLLAERYAAPFTADANDFLFQWESSADYNPAPNLDKIKAPLLAINSADDERNPPELGTMERELKRIKGARLYLIPASENTRGHGTTAMAVFWKQQLQEFLAAAPIRSGP